MGGKQVKESFIGFQNLAKIFQGQRTDSDLGRWVRFFSVTSVTSVKPKMLPTDVYIIIVNFSGNPMCGPLKTARRRAQENERFVANNEISFYPSAHVALSLWRLYFPKWRKITNYYCKTCGDICHRSNQYAFSGQISKCGC